MASMSVTSPCLIARVECAVITRVRSATSSQTMGTSAKAVEVYKPPVLFVGDTSGSRVVAEVIGSQRVLAACVHLDQKLLFIGDRAFKNTLAHRVQCGRKPLALLLGACVHPIHVDI